MVKKNLFHSDTVESHRSEQGATLVEAVLVMPLFLMFFIVAIELLRVSYTQITMQYVAARVAREISINYGSGVNVEERFKELFNRFAVGFDKNRDVITVCPLSLGSCAPGTLSFGAAREPVIVRVSKRVTLFFVPQRAVALVISSGELRLSAFTVLSNEPPFSV